MKKFDLVVKNGTVVTPEGRQQADLAIQNGIIEAIGENGLFTESDQFIDAKGLHVLPGLIDDHVHFREPGFDYKEDFETGSRAAVYGGVTTIIDMPNTDPPLTGVENLKEKVKKASGRSYVDFGFYAAITESSIPQMQALARNGIMGFKLFMGETTGYIRCPNDGLIYQAFKNAKETGLRVGAHAENDAILQHLKGELIEQGRTDPVAHLESRPSLAEAEAISRAILLSEAAGNSFHVFHLSSKEGLELVVNARRRGLPVTAEVLVAHLLMNANDYTRFGNMMRLNPPIRAEVHQQALWRGIERGWIDIIATDHAPHSREEKTATNVWEAACGFIGVETALPLMLTEVNKGSLSLERYVELTSRNPAKTWGLYPRKGSLQFGAQADIVLVDLMAETTIEAKTLHNKNTETPFNGWRVRGLPVYTVLRGQVIMADGELTGPPAGRLVKPGQLKGGGRE